MATWQATLQLLVRNNKTFSLHDQKRNEFQIMKYFVDDPLIRKELMSYLHNVEHGQFLYKKNIQKSEELRKQGNKAFRDKNYFSSIKYYTLSLQFAPWESEDLPLALANRSAALFYMEQYEACVKDIKLALQCAYPTNLVYKLYLRSAQCYLKLCKKELMKEALHKAQGCLENNSILLSSKKADLEKEIITLLSNLNTMEETDNINYIDTKLPKLAIGKNLNFADASAALDLKFSIDKGRYVVTNQDIKKGEILFVEKPFAFVLLDNEYSEAVCANCCKSTENVPIPCKFCASTVYCDETCRQEAWLTYHQWECFGHQIGLWDQIGISHLTIRTLLNCCYADDLTKFNKIHCLVTNINKISSQDMFVYGVSAFMMSLYLHTFTNFFKIINIYENLYTKFENNELNISLSNDLTPKTWSESLNVLYISGLLLRNMLQLICNGHAITRLNRGTIESKNIVTEYQCRVATAIYLSASMMNHSCDPNIINSFKDQYLIVKATKDIPAKEEVLNCYGPHFRQMNMQERQMVLKNQYCFLCDCNACSDRALQHFADKFKKLNCQECQGPLEIVNNSTMICLECENISDFVEKKLIELQKANELYDAAEIHIKSGKLIDALEKVRNCLKIRKQYLYKHHEAIASAYDLIAKILASMGRWLESIVYLEYSIVAVEERFGPDSIELANELNKITDICIKYLQEEQNTNTKQYKNILKKSRRFLNRAEKILHLNYGSWNDAYREISEKQKGLMPLLENMNL